MHSRTCSIPNFADQHYGVASKNSAYHCVEVVPIKCECQRIVWKRDGALDMDKCMQVTKIEMDMGEKETAIRVIPPDEPMVSLGDKSNMLLS